MSSADLMRMREADIGELVQFLSAKSEGFAKPRMVVIGGYAMRAFVPFARYSRDCDFALQKGLETVKGWKPETVQIEAFEQEDGFGFMRWARVFGSGKQKAKLGVDFMAGEVRGREGEVFAIDKTFLSGAREAQITIAGKTHDVLVPSYADFFVLKVMAARRSDVRDLAALVAVNGPPPQVRLSALNDQSIFVRHLKEKVIPAVEGPLFMDSWRGMFPTAGFDDERRQQVARELRKLL